MNSLSKVIIATVAVLAVAIAALSALVSQLNLSEQLEQVAAKQGYQLKVAGDIGWSVWPAPSVTLSEITFSDSADPQQANLRAEITKLSVAADWQQIVSGQLGLDTIALDGADIAINNFAALAAMGGTSKSTASESPSSANSSLNINHIDITNSSISAPLAGYTTTVAIEGELNLSEKVGAIQAVATEQTAVNGQLAIDLEWRSGGKATVNLRKARLNIGSLSGAQPLWIEQLQAQLDASSNAITLHSLTGNLGGGKIEANGHADITTDSTTFSAKSQLQQLSIEPLLASQKSDLPLAGLINFTGDWSGTIPLASKANTSLLAIVTGRGQLNSEALLFTATNLERDFCSAATLLEGKSLSKQRAVTANQSAQTELQEISANWQLSQGKLFLNDIAGGTEALSLQGDGNVELTKQRYQLDFSATLDSAIASSRGCDVSDKLANRPLPFTCKGNYSDQPSQSCSLDQRVVRQLLKTKLIETLQRKLEKNSDNALIPLLDKLFQ